MIGTLGFDADDTLWHNENIYAATHERFRQLLRPFHPDDWIDARLQAAEMRNLARFGYGIKGFTLSMIETAIELTEGRIPGRDIQQVVDLGKEMLDHPVETLPGVRNLYSVCALCPGNCRICCRMHIPQITTQRVRRRGGALSPPA